VLDVLEPGADSACKATLLADGRECERVAPVEEAGSKVVEVLGHEERSEELLRLDGSKGQRDALLANVEAVQEGDSTIAVARHLGRLVVRVQAGDGVYQLSLKDEEVGEDLDLQLDGESFKGGLPWTSQRR
jgi:hypothetical protein